MRIKRAIVVSLAAGALLLSVAARRLAVPDALARAPASFAALFRARPRAKRSERPENPAGGALGSLLEAKARSEAELSAARAPTGPIPHRPAARVPRAPPPPESETESPPSVPRFSQPPPSAAGQSPSSRPSERKLTAAEVLLARRRGRKG